MRHSGARGTLIYEKNLMPKISCQTPFKIRAYSIYDYLMGGGGRVKQYCYGLSYARLEKGNQIRGRGLCFQPGAQNHG